MVVASRASGLPRLDHPSWPWLLVLLLQSPVLLALWRGPWQQAEQGYAPLLLGLTLGGLYWRLQSAPASPPGRRVLCAGLLLAGSGLYVVGRLAELELLAALAGVVWLLALLYWRGGWLLLRRLAGWPALLLLLLPYPAWWLDQLTGPLRWLVAEWAEAVLLVLGYPVARDGVILALGPYRLWVADACSGWHGLLFLLAAAGLYLQLRALRHAWVLLLCVLPLALLGNLLRVLALALLTYHFGEAAGQGWRHEALGLLGFALTLQGLAWLARRWPVAPPVQARSVPVARPWGEAVAGSAWLLLTALLATALQPQARQSEARALPELALAVPEKFASWQVDREFPVLAASETPAAGLYQQTLYRSYRNPQGQRVMLALAYGSQQRGNALQVHRPEFCYLAQGFTLLASQDRHWRLGEQRLPVRRLLLQRGTRSEPVSYWLSVGGQAVLPGWGRQWAQLRSALRGEVADGLLLRVSSLGSEASAEFELQERFLRELAAALPQELQFLFAVR